MRRVVITLAAAAALLTGGFGVTTASAATSVGWCDGVKAVQVSTGGDYVRQPYHKGTGSRNCTLAEGASGTAVTALQQGLKSCNFASNLAVDGDFGQATKKAVTFAQLRRGIPQDGIYGSISRTRFQWQVFKSDGAPSARCVNTN